MMSGSMGFDLGNSIAPPSWSYLDAQKSGVLYAMTGAQQCWASGALQTYKSNIILRCASTQAKGFVITQEPGSCTFNLTMETPLACASKSPVFQLKQKIRARAQRGALD